MCCLDCVASAAHGSACCMCSFLPVHPAASALLQLLRCCSAAQCMPVFAHLARRGDETHWALTVTVTDMHSVGPQKPPDRPPAGYFFANEAVALHAGASSHFISMLPCGLQLASARPQSHAPLSSSECRPLRQFGAILSPLVMLNRRGARLAEAVNISMNPLRRLSRRKAKAAAAAAAAAAAPGLAAAAGQEDSGGSSGAAGGSATTSVVSAPDWPPVKRQPAVASEQEQQQQPKRRRPRPPERQKQQQQQRGEQREQQPERAPSIQQASPSSSGRASGEADVRAFLRKSGGGAKLPLSPWEDADAAAKRQQAQLLGQVGAQGARLIMAAGVPCKAFTARSPCMLPACLLWLCMHPSCLLTPAPGLICLQDAPKRKHLDEYDLEYDKGRTKKVKSKRQSGGDGGGDGVQGADFDAAWQQKQHSGVKTELRGNRKRRSQDFKRQQQQQQGRRHSGGRGRPSFGGRGGRHGRGRR